MTMSSSSGSASASMKPRMRCRSASAGKRTAPLDGDGDLPPADGGDVTGHPLQRARHQSRLLGKLALDAGIDVDGTLAQVIAIDQTARRINAPRIELTRSLASEQDVTFGRTNERSAEHLADGFLLIAAVAPVEEGSEIGLEERAGQRRADDCLLAQQIDGSIEKLRHQCAATHPIVRNGIGPSRHPWPWPIGHGKAAACQAHTARLVP